MEIQEFTLVNTEKLERALNGTQTGSGTVIGGVGSGAYFDDGWKRNGEPLSESEVATLEHALLAEYDKIGGLVMKGDDKVKTGSFYNFTARKPRATPEVVFTYLVNGQIVDVPAEEETPGIVKAAKKVAKTVANKVKSK